MIDIYQVYLPDFDSSKVDLPNDIVVQSQKYKLVKKRHEFIVSQWIRRNVLTGYLGCNGNEIIFSATKKGRPFIVGHQQIDFNISHTKDYVVMAVAKNQKVGVDIQSIKETVDVLAIAKQYFTMSEYLWLISLTLDKQSYFFASLWALKEASLKLTGQGIVYGLDHYSFVYEHDKFKQLENNMSMTLNYYIQEVDNTNILAVSAQQKINQLSYFTLDCNGWVKKI